MSDLVERLRAERPQFYESTMKEAADEIERLRAEVKRWHLAYEEARDMARCVLEATSKE